MQSQKNPTSNIVQTYFTIETYWYLRESGQVEKNLVFHESVCVSFKYPKMYECKPKLCVSECGSLLICQFRELTVALASIFVRGGGLLEERDPFLHVLISYWRPSSYKFRNLEQSQSLSLVLLQKLFQHIKSFLISILLLNAGILAFQFYTECNDIAPTFSCEQAF